MIENPLKSLIFFILDGPEKSQKRDKNPLSKNTDPAT
jgi:hypothetical protein